VIAPNVPTLCASHAGLDHVFAGQSRASGGTWTPTGCEPHWDLNPATAVTPRILQWSKTGSDLRVCRRPDDLVSASHAAFDRVRLQNVCTRASSCNWESQFELGTGTEGDSHTGRRLEVARDVPTLRRSGR
jgi:hypothetical protein